jgi:hypothetical protein
LISLLASFAFAGEIMVSVASHGAVPDDGLDDSASFTAALTALAELSLVVPNDDQVLFIPAGTWDLVNSGNTKRGLLVDQPATLRCAPGAVLQGEPDSVHTSKDMLEFMPAPGEIELSGVGITGCKLIFDRAHASNEQAHAMVFWGGSDQNAWIRDVTVRDVTIGPVGSGDAIYCGARCEGLTVQEAVISDVARNGVTVSGNSGTLNSRRGFLIEDIRANWTGFNLTQEDGVVVDLEPNQTTVRLFDVTIRGIRAPTATLNAINLKGGLIEDVDVSWVQTSKLDGTVFRGLRMNCRDGTGGDGAGYCFAHFQPPSIFTVSDSTFRVSAEGEGVFYIRDYRADPFFSDYDQVYGVAVTARVQLNGGVLVRPDLIADPLLISTDVTFVQ